MNDNKPRRGKLNFLHYEIGHNGEFILFSGNERVATADNLLEAYEEESKYILEV